MQEKLTEREIQELTECTKNALGKLQSATSDITEKFAGVISGTDSLSAAEYRSFLTETLKNTYEAECSISTFRSEPNFEICTLADKVGVLVSATENAVDKDTFEALDDIGVEIIDALTELLRYKALGPIEWVTSAVELQKAKKPLDRYEEKTKDGIGMYTAADRWCPNCHRMLIDGYAHSGMVKKRQYCDCGQKL